MDVVLVGFIGAMIAGGWRTGFLRRLIGLGFVALSFVLSAYFRYPVGAIAGTFFKDIPADYANLVGYTIAFPACLAVLHLASRSLIGRVSVAGLSKVADQGLGAIVGGIEAVLAISAVVVIADAYFGTNSTLTREVGPALVRSVVSALNASTTVHLLRASTVPAVLAVLGPIMPSDVTTLRPTGVPAGGVPGLPSLPLPTP